jgi:thiol-disulfide isomerase/thioredoxin
MLKLTLRAGIVAIAFGCNAVAAETPTTKPTSPAESARLSRGAELREVLLATLERSFADGQRWPDEPVYTPSAKPAFKYTRPPVPEKPDDYDPFASATVVLRERFEDHADGVWVGFGDGHLEFAPSPAALSECLAQVDLAEADAAKHKAGTKPVQSSAPVKGVLKLKLADEYGAPVAGAQVGVFGQWGDRRANAWHTFFVSERDEGNAPLVSNDAGDVVLPGERVFVPPFRFSEDPEVPLYVLQEQRGLVALERVARSDFKDGARGDSRVIRLQPACKVTGDVTCVGAAPASRARVTWTNSFVYPIGQIRLHSIASTFDDSHFEMLLPPGDFGLAARAEDCDSMSRFIRIEPGRRELNLQIDLPPTRLVTMLGKPAPELAQIKAWKNGGPVKLADLRGKVVVLDFWGFWCGPCVSSMPTLMKLHDEFKDRGLVIIAVHDDSVESIAEMDEKLKGVRQELWGGRDLPFLVALDGGGPTRVRGSRMMARGATTAAYGVTKFPTTLLIDADGKLVKELYPHQPSAREDIAAALDARDKRSAR